MSKMSDMSDLLRGRIRPCFVKYDSKSASAGAAEGSEGFDSLLASRLPVVSPTETLNWIAQELSNLRKVHIYLHTL